MSARPLDRTALRDWSHAAVSGLITHADEINGLNVFPVADADTGTNMLFTMRSATACADSVMPTRTSRASPPRSPRARCRVRGAIPA